MVLLGCTQAEGRCEKDRARQADTGFPKRSCFKGAAIMDHSANPKLIEDDYLSEVARAVFERIGKSVPVQVVGGLSIARAKSLAKAGLRAFVISGNMGLPDGNARYNLPPADIQRLVAGFIAEVSGG